MTVSRKTEEAEDWEELLDGEWRFLVSGFYKHGCCDCGLVHVVEYRMYKGRPEFRVKRDNRATSALRRRRKKATP